MKFKIRIIKDARKTPAHMITVRRMQTKKIRSFPGKMIKLNPR